ADEGIVLGDTVGLALVDVDAEDLGQIRQAVLAVVEGIVGQAAVAGADVEHAVLGAELELAALVVVERLGEVQQDAFAGGVDLVAALGHLEFGDDRADWGTVDRVVGVDVAVLGELGVEGDREQTALVIDVDLFREVEERLGAELAVVPDADLAGLLNDV